MPVSYGVSVCVHAFAEVMLLLAIALLMRLLQNYVPMALYSIVGRSGGAVLERWIPTVHAPVFLTGPARKLWSPSSVLCWFLFTFGASFSLHLPSLWRKRVQLARAFRSLGGNWYNVLDKPIWWPAGYFFPFLWTPVKLVRVVGHSVVWEHVERQFYAAPIILIVVSFVLADMWNQVVFVQHDLVGGLIILLFQFGTLVSLILYTLFELPSATKLFIPYTTAVCVSFILNAELYRRNRNPPLHKAEEDSL